MSRVNGERALGAPPPPPPPVPHCLPTPPSWLLRSEMDLVERLRGSLSRSTLLLRESILEVDEEGAGEGGRERLQRGRGTGGTLGRRVAAGRAEEVVI